MPSTVQSGVNVALLNVNDDSLSFQAVTTLLGPQLPSRNTLTPALLIVSCVVESACPVQGVAPLMNPQSVPPVNDVDVMLTTPVGVIVPVKVAWHCAAVEPLVRLVEPVTENGSPLGFIG
ncbi:hypothetical protein F7R11_07170 [Ralstonia insidiosa]|nr:hypothetical protein F7R11_07170 [Ralstonia insidiosa]